MTDLTGATSITDTTPVVTTHTMAGYKDLDGTAYKPAAKAEEDITVQSSAYSVESNWEAAREAMSLLVKAKEERQKRESERLAADFGRVFDMCRMILQHPDLFPLIDTDIKLPSYTYHCTAFVFGVNNEKIALTDSGGLYAHESDAPYWVSIEKARTSPLFISHRLLEIIQEKATEAL